MRGSHTRSGTRTLHGVVGGISGEARRHHTLEEGADGAVAVVAANPEDDGTLRVEQRSGMSANETLLKAVQKAHSSSSFDFRVRPATRSLPLC